MAEPIFGGVGRNVFLKSNPVGRHPDGRHLPQLLRAADHGAGLHRRGRQPGPGGVVLGHHRIDRLLDESLERFWGPGCSDSRRGNPDLLAQGTQRSLGGQPARQVGRDWRQDEPLGQHLYVLGDEHRRLVIGAQQHGALAELSGNGDQSLDEPLLRLTTRCRPDDRPPGVTRQGGGSERVLDDGVYRHARPPKRADGSDAAVVDGVPADLQQDHRN